MLDTLFPLGLEQYIVGGLLVGVGIAIPFIFTGVVAGVSTFFTSVWSYVNRGSFFQTDWYLQSRGWRWFLVAGIVSGGAIYTLLHGLGDPTTVAGWRLFVGGLLVGVGARMSGGCTSGHAICGLAALEKVSLVATIVFLVTAIIVANLTSYLFVW